MKKYLLPSALGLLGGFAGAALLLYLRPVPAPEIRYMEDPASVRYSSLPAGSPDAMNGDFVTASAQSTQSVVYIQTVSQSQRSVSWFDMFFGGSGTQQVQSSGSGVIWTADGHIITNGHVIENADEIEVIYKKRPYKARVVGTDPNTDLAVLKIEAGGKLPAIAQGHSQNLAVGEWVLAVGNPLNLQSTVTAGIVSAKGRHIGVNQTTFPLESFIQTDAAINPGNSGGALVNLKGELVGINTAIVSPTGSYSGYGFAVPVDIVKKVVNDMIQYGKVQKAYAGADFVDLDYETAQRLGAPDQEGVVLNWLQAEGPAEKAGLSKDDIVTAVDGIPVHSRSNFDEAISYKSPGNRVKLRILRGGKASEVEVLLVNENGETGIVKDQAVFSKELGASLEPVTQLEKSLYKVEHGVKIKDLRAGLMARIGLPEGYIITAINGKPMLTPDVVVQTILNTRGRVTVEGVNKNGSRGYYQYYY